MAPKTVDARLGWIPQVTSAADILPGHRLRLASLSSLSGYPICSAPLPTSTKAPHAQKKNKSNSPSPASSSLRTSERTRGKQAEVVIPISDTDEDEDDPIASYSPDGDDLQVERPKPPECNKRKCENNPNCLRWSGPGLWADKGQSAKRWRRRGAMGWT